MASRPDDRRVIVAVGGDYTHPDAEQQTAWTTAGKSPANQAHPLFRFSPAATEPGGYRSSVAFNATSKEWIAVGPNGTDLSEDDGKHWHAARSSNQLGGTDAGWNAIALPFVVGPEGRIGRLISPPQ